MQNIATNLMNASMASLLNTMNPLFICLFAVIFLHEAITWNFLLGGALISAGVIIGLSGGKGGKLPEELS